MAKEASAVRIAEVDLQALSKSVVDSVKKEPEIGFGHLSCSEEIALVAELQRYVHAVSNNRL